MRAASSTGVGLPMARPPQDERDDRAALLAEGEASELAVERQAPHQRAASAAASAAASVKGSEHTGPSQR